jgi:hypothetical protein
MEVALIVWFGFAICCGVIAGAKARTALGWFLLGLVFGIFALICIACIPSRQRAQAVTHVGPINMSGNPRINSVEIWLGRALRLLIVAIIAGALVLWAKARHG